MAGKKKAEDEKLPNAQVLLLIDIVKKYEVVWNPRHVDYRLNNKKNEAWSAIEKEMKEAGCDASIETMKTRWKGIRDYQQRLTTGSAADSSSYAFAKALEFLNPVRGSKSSRTTNVIVTKKKEEKLDEEKEIDEDLDVDDFEEDEFEYSSVPPSPASSTASAVSNVRKEIGNISMEAKSPSKKKTKRSRELSPVSASVKDYFDLKSKKVGESSSTADPLDAFGKSFVADLKKIREVDPKRATQVRIDAQVAALNALSDLGV